ncbi:hypothetical protein D3C71_1189420 [compost metagenome]
MNSSRVQAGAWGKTLARVSTVGKPFKAYKPHQKWAGEPVVKAHGSRRGAVHTKAPEQTLARASTVGKPSKAYKPHQPRLVRRSRGYSIRVLQIRTCVYSRQLMAGVTGKRWQALRRSVTPNPLRTVRGPYEASWIAVAASAAVAVARKRPAL